jgi:hypothetical protein
MTALGASLCQATVVSLACIIEPKEFVTILRLRERALKDGGNGEDPGFFLCTIPRGSPISVTELLVARVITRSEETNFPRPSQFQTN